MHMAAQPNITLKKIKQKLGGKYIFLELSRVRQLHKFTASMNDSSQTTATFVLVIGEGCFEADYRTDEDNHRAA